MVRKCIFSGCDRNALEKSNYCILHENYRSTTYDEDYLNREKAKALYEEIKSGVRNFKGCIFPEISLTNMNFQNINFTDCVFKGAVDFSGSKFKGKTSFENCIFESDALFESCEFVGYTSFEEASFKKYANFIDSIFYSKINFESVYFSDVTFYNAEFNENVSFSNSIFTGFVRFEGSSNNLVFYSEAEFDDISFRLPNEVEFINLDLSRASFFNTNIEDVRFADVKWATAGKLFRRKAIYNELLIDQKVYRDYELVADIYRRLRASYEKRLQYQYASDFYIGEMEIKRKNCKFKNRILKFITQNLSFIALYKYFSLYGENYYLPIIWIFLTILLFGYLFSHLFKLQSLDPYALSALTFFQMIPSSVMKKLASNMTLSVVFLIERLLGILFTALFVLALRRRFKKMTL